jgi:DNA repair exonuclease SbcCD ATPase subunit
VAYRDELEALKRRIEELEGNLKDRTRERDRLDSLNNLGPEAYGLYSRVMYRLGRAVGRALSFRRPSDPARAIEAARQRVRLLEQRLAQVEEDILRASKTAAEASLRKAEEFNEEKRKKRAKEPD